MSKPTNFWLVELKEKTQVRKKKKCSTTTINQKQLTTKDITIIDEISNPKLNLAKTLV